MDAVTQLARQVGEATRPVLLVVDYAETRPEVAALVDVMADGSPAHPVRLLLLARTGGAWWTRLTEAHDPGIVQRINLKPLAEAGQARRDAYAATMIGLARHLAGLPDAPAEDQPWTALAEDLAAHPLDLDDPRLGNALTLQITGLTTLLAAAAGKGPTGAFGEYEFIAHERGYLRQAAAKRKLLDPGVLSDRTDDDERAAEAWAALERALAGVILLGPCETGEARAIGALASEARAGDVTNWLAALYPPADEGFSLGAVQPDRLAELLLGPILIQEPNLLARVGGLAESVRESYSVLFTLMRTAAHPDLGQVGEMTTDLIASRAVPFAVAAPILAAALPQPTPLLDGLIRLGKQDSRIFKQCLYAAVGPVPYPSISGASFSANLYRILTEDILRPLAADNPETYLPDLAFYLRNLGVLLSQAGQLEGALAAAQEAVTLYRQLAATNPDAHLSNLASALNQLGNRWADAGGLQNALASGQEAVSLYRQLAATNPDAHLSNLASALNNFGNRLSEAGQHLAALDPAQEAVTLYRQLADTNSDAYLPGLASALNNFGNHLAGAGQHQAALTSTQEAVTLYRKLADTNPDAHLSNLASALNNLGSKLSEAGQHQAALAPTQEAVTIFGHLAAVNPDAQLHRLVAALYNLSQVLIGANRDVEVTWAWETAIAGLPDESSRLTLSVECARYLLSTPSTSPGTAVKLLVNVLTAPTVPGEVEAGARRLLRGCWRQDPDGVEAVLRSAKMVPVPNWMYLTDDDIDSVVGWLDTGTWVESLQYFRDHSNQLLADVTRTVLDELALAGPEDLISQHRSLLDSIRENGLKAAYQALLPINILEEWIAISDWQDSRAFLHDHPELMNADIFDLLASLAEGRDYEVRFHQALLALAQTPEGIDQAYRSLEDVQSLRTIVNQAVAAQDTIRLMACSDIEIMHGRFFAGTLHTILAALLANPSEMIPQGVVSELRVIAAQTEPAERDTALAEFSAALVGIPVAGPVSEQLQHILVLLRL
jgi:hypothetical protein